tara:strand:- start:149 stop:487 length:339 start_codon:yes stop_codon:yes gene_type:complete
MAEHEDMKKDMPMPKPTMPMPPEGARTLNEAMPPEGVDIMKRPDQSIQMVLLSRLESMSPEELKELDRAIDSKTAKILMKLLPELEELINASMSNKGGAPKDDMGALGGMMG